jgi:hypothetical protein
LPAKSEILKEILLGSEEAQPDPDFVRRKYLAEVSRLSGRDTILYATGWTSPKFNGLIPSNFFSLVTEDIQGFMAALHGLTGSKLDLIVHSPGGSLEAADQVVQYLRAKYDNIRAIVPHNAMSAACMLCCACDEIIMGKQSAIGPIDPQLSWPSPQGTPVSAAAQSLLDELKEAREVVGSNPHLAPIWATRLQQFPPGIFATCRTTMELAESKVREWLENYMFRSDPASHKPAEISAWLAAAPTHKTHGRPIGFDLCLEKGLKVTRLESSQEFQDAVLSVFHAASITFESTGFVKMIESHLGRGHYVSVSAS